MTDTNPMILPVKGWKPRRGRPPIALSDLASLINTTATEIEDRRAKFCVLIAEAQYRVARETNQTFAVWARDNLRKPSGAPWALTYLYKLAMFGRAPSKLREHRAQISRAGRADRQASAALREIERAHSIRLESIEAEVNFLMAAWERASEPARRRFLDLIGARRKT